MSRRTIMLLLVVLCIATLALRYPLVDHERFQSDSYFVHLLSQSIVSNGRAVWTFNPLSYFGYYPVSYPSGVPFVLSELSILTGLDVEVVILISGMLMGIIMCLGSFCLARQFIRRSEYAILAVFLVSMGSRFVDTTYWNGSARAPVVVLMVLVLVVLLRFRLTRQKSLLSLGAILLAGCFAVHHMAILFILFGIAYVADVIAIQYVLPRARIRKRSVGTSYVIVMGAAVFVVAFGFFEFFGQNVESYSSGGALFDFNPPILSAIANMGVSYVNQIGLIVVFAVVGLPLVFRQTRLTFEGFFLVGSILFFVPVLGSGLYLSMVLSILVSILGVNALLALHAGGRRKRLLAMSIVLLIVFSIVLPIWSVNRWNSAEQLTGDKVRIDNQVFNDAAYIGDLSGRDTSDKGFAISNTDVRALQLGAISGTKFLKSDIMAAISGDINSSYVRDTLTWSEAAFPKNLYSWYEYKETPYIDSVIQGLIINGVSFANQTPPYLTDAHGYFVAHSRLVVVLDNDWKNSFVSVWGIAPAKLPAELHSCSWTYGDVLHPGLESYILYQSEGTTAFIVQLPV